MHLNPNGLGVEPFLTALQASADSTSAMADDSKPPADKPADDKMDES